MTKNNPYQREYIYRINKVIDYIERNLTENHSVSSIAAIACFSPFHFHRIFSAFKGETINQFIKRKRLEKAASLLLANKETPVNEIAFKVGYENNSVFCRAFKEHFKLSAQNFREYKENYLNSKIGKPISKNDTLSDIEPLYFGAEENNKKWFKIMKENIEIKEMPELKLVYCRHVGAFELIGAVYGKLFRWGGARGLLDDDTKGVTVYHDDPNVTEIENLHQSACFTVKEEVKTEGEFGYMTIPGGKFIVGHFEIDAKGFEHAWKAVCLFLSESGYQPSDGFPYELYHNDHEQHPEKKFIVDICIPVKPL